MSGLHAAWEDDQVICTHILVSSTTSTLGRVSSAASSVLQELFLYIVIAPSSLGRQKEIALLQPSGPLWRSDDHLNLHSNLSFLDVSSTVQMEHAHPDKLVKWSKRDVVQVSATTIEDMCKCKVDITIHTRCLHCGALCGCRQSKKTSKEIGI